MRARDSFSTLTVGTVVATTLIIADADGNEVGLWDGTTLSVATPAEVDAVAAAAAAANANADGRIPISGAADDINSNATTITGAKVRTGAIESAGYNGPDGAETFADAGSSFDLDNSRIITENLRSDSAGVSVRGGGGAGTVTLEDGSGVTWGSFDGSTITLGPGGGTSLEVIEGSVILEGSNFATIEAPDVVALSSGNIVVISAASDYVAVQSGYTTFEGTVDADDITTNGDVDISNGDLVLDGDHHIVMGSGVDADKIQLFGTSYTIGIESSTMVFRSGSNYRWRNGTTSTMYLYANGNLLLYGTLLCNDIDTRGGNLNLGGGVITEVNEISADVGSVSDVSYHFDGQTDSGMSGGTDGAVRLSSNGDTVFAGLNNEAYIAPSWDLATTSGSYMRVTGSGGRIGRHSSSMDYKTDARPITLEEARRALDIEWIRYRPNELTMDRTDWTHYGASAEQVEQVDPRLAQYDADMLGPGVRPEGVNYDQIAAPLHGVLIQDHEARLIEAEAEIDNLKKELVEIKKMLVSLLP